MISRHLDMSIDTQQIAIGGRGDEVKINVKKAKGSG